MLLLWVYIFFICCNLFTLINTSLRGLQRYWSCCFLLVAIVVIITVIMNRKFCKIFIELYMCVCVCELLVDYVDNYEYFFLFLRGRLIKCLTHSHCVVTAMVYVTCRSLKNSPLGNSRQSGDRFRITSHGVPYISS